MRSFSVAADEAVSQNAKKAFHRAPAKILLTLIQVGKESPQNNSGQLTVSKLKRATDPPRKQSRVEQRSGSEGTSLSRDRIS